MVRYGIILFRKIVQHSSNPQNSTIQNNGIIDSGLENHTDAGRGNGQTGRYSDVDCQRKKANLQIIEDRQRESPSRYVDKHTQ